MSEEDHHHEAEDRERMAVSGLHCQVLELAGSCLQKFVDTDHEGDRRVLDDVHDQADQRGQQPAESLGQDHERVATDPTEAEPRGGLMLFLRNRPHRPARCLGDLSAPPEREGDRRGHVRVEPNVKWADRVVRKPVDEEDRHENRKAAPDFDVEPDQPLERTELDRHQGPEQDPDHHARRDRDHREPQRLRQALPSMYSATGRNQSDCSAT